MARWHRRMTILRFHTPLIEPDRRISRIRLSDKACERNPERNPVSSEIRERNPVSVHHSKRNPEAKSGVSRLCRLAAPGMMKMELDFGSLWLEAGVG